MIYMDIYNESLQQMKPLFTIGTYTTLNQDRLQEDFKWFASQEVRLNTEVPPSELDPKRVKVCKVCGDIFYSIGKKNKQMICNNKPYKKHKKDGSPYKSAGRKSACQMEYQRRRYKRL